ncbi:cysteine-rich receptor-like protein kinase [Trifolium pratense]|uniref:Cysteine-rich receptor-like protein kinase n=1 Tax=Trifolium pratense TaxID=57577 RepID=A0A2K3PFS8_TRIPR|nr:cysteine-rich receptor-like protein kinase [Trifolium pratense]
MEAISDPFVHNLWGSSECDWAFLPAVGSSGGILSIWNKVKATLVFTFMGEDSVERRGFRDNWSGAQSTEMVAFDGFLNNLELVDMPLIGRTFTWFHPNGVTMGRLDRVLISPSWFDMWGAPNAWVLARDVADHCPIVLKYSSFDWGPKPFRLNNFWEHNSDFKGVIKEAWESIEITGWMGFILKERLKVLKGVIKEWKKTKFGKVEEEESRLLNDILVLDLRSESLGLVEAEVGERKVLFEKLWNILKSIDAMTFQRSRSRWLKEGDSNTKYFHNCIKARHRRNRVVALRTTTGWVEGPVGVRGAVVSYFRDHFDNEDWHRPTLDGITFPCLSLANADLLTASFTMEEISEVVKGCDGSKSPGPDGFNFAFIKEFWEIMKHDVRIMFDQFHGNACLPKSLLSYFITLIPKVHSPQALGDFRPISLLGCLYKMIAKVLATRLALVIGDLIPKTQSAFLKGRQLVEGVVVVNEVIDFAKKAGKKCLIFKVDFEKAYDSVDWSFLDYMLGRFGFNVKWRAWMKACICSGSMSVLVNGSPTEEISIKRGLKQGDSLAPLLFLIVAEGLGALMREAVQKGYFKPFLVGRGRLPVSILQYADDTLCIGEATVENLWTLKAVLRGFELVSGLKVNFWKSCLVGVNVSHDFLHMASTFLNCRIGRIPFIYLGLPVGANPHRYATWVPMMDAIKRRLGVWGNKYISLGGRIVLINAVLSAIPIFYLSYMKMPVKVWKEVGPSVGELEFVSKMAMEITHRRGGGMEECGGSKIWGGSVG